MGIQINGQTDIISAVDGSLTISGADLSNVANLNATGIVTATEFRGDGSNLTSINASNLGSGTIPDARFPATLPAVSGASLTSLNASNLGSGTIPDARFPATLPAVSGANLTNLPSTSAFSSGTLMLFQQTAAPTGWTKQTTHNNKALRVVSGTASSGGTTAFTSVFASRTPSGTVGNTTLTTTQMPSHSHNYFRSVLTSTGTNVQLAGGTGAAIASSSTGGGGSHNHSFTGSAMDFAVQYVDLIIASKD